MRSGPGAGVGGLGEERGTLPGTLVQALFPRVEEQEALEALVRRRLVFRAPVGEVLALSRLVRGLPA